MSKLVADFETSGGRLQVVEDSRGVLHMIETQPILSAFAIGQRVVKVTAPGEDRIEGEVRAAFTNKRGTLRYVVEHEARAGGSLLCIYAEANLVPMPR